MPGAKLDHPATNRNITPFCLTCLLFSRQENFKTGDIVPISYIFQILAHAFPTPYGALSDCHIKKGLWRCSEENRDYNPMGWKMERYSKSNRLLPIHFLRWGHMPDIKEGREKLPKLFPSWIPGCTGWNIYYSITAIRLISGIRDDRYTTSGIAARKLGGFFWKQDIEVSYLYGKSRLGKTQKYLPMPDMRAKYMPMQRNYRYRKRDIHSTTNLSDVLVLRNFIVQVRVGTCLIIWILPIVFYNGYIWTDVACFHHVYILLQCSLEISISRHTGAEHCNLGSFYAIIRQCLPNTLEGCVQNYSTIKGTAHKC